MKNITIGADPELFIIDTTTNKVVSSVGMIPGVKGDPYTKGLPKGFGLETDNILAEFNIPPCTNELEFISSINYMKDYIREFVKEINPNYDILCAASQVVDDDQLQSDQAKEFGCSVDFNAYTRSKNPKPKGTSTNLRSAGCHLHVGYDNKNIDRSLQAIRAMDFYIGIPSVLIDSDTKRRSLYGKAGCFRLTDYGFEYRVLSSYMMSDNKYLSFIWKQLQYALSDDEYASQEFDPKQIQSIINNNNVEEANNIVKAYKKFFSNIPI